MFSASSMQIPRLRALPKRESIRPGPPLGPSRWTRPSRRDRGLLVRRVGVLRL